MVGAYRTVTRELPPRVADMYWRTRVAVGTRRVFFVLFLLCLPVSISGSPDWLRQLTSLALSLLLARFTWQMTAPRPNAAARGRAARVALRGCTIAGACIASIGFVSFVIGISPANSIYVWSNHAVEQLARGATIAGAAYMSMLFREIGHRSLANSTHRVTVLWAILFGAALISDLIATGAQLAPQVIGAIAVLLALYTGFLLFRLGRSLRIESHAWWYKEGAGWASVTESADRVFEVLEANGDSTQLSSAKRAREWLAESGYVPEARALDEQRLLAPPPPVPLADKLQLLLTDTPDREALAAASRSRNSAGSQNRSHRPNEGPEISS